MRRQMEQLLIPALNQHTHTQEALSDSLVSRCERLGGAQTGTTWLKVYGSLGNVGGRLLKERQWVL